MKPDYSVLVYDVKATIQPFFFFFLLATELLSYSAELKRLVLFLCLHVKYEATVL